MTDATGDKGYALVVFWHAKPGNADVVAKILVELAERTMTEPGAISFRVHRDTSNDHAFVLYELYRNEDAFKAHRASEHFRQLVLETAVPLLERRDLNFSVPMFDLPAADGSA